MLQLRLFVLCLGLAIPLLVGAGCATTASSGRSQSLVKLADDYVAAWNAHDASRAASFFAEDGEYFDASIGKPEVGRANAEKNVIQAFMTAIPDLVWTRDTGPAIVGKKGIAFEWTLSGTNTGDFADGTKATGKSFSIRGATLIRVKDGQIVSQGDYYDAYSFLKQLGLAQ